MHIEFFKYLNFLQMHKNPQSNNKNELLNFNTLFRYNSSFRNVIIIITAEYLLSNLYKVTNFSSIKIKFFTFDKKLVDAIY